MHGRSPVRTLAAGLLCGAAALWGPAAHAGPHDFVAYVTRLGGDPDAARPYITTFLTYLESEVGWPKGSAKGEFKNTKKAALEYIEANKPGIGLIEPALYLELRKGQDLQLLAEVTSKDLSSETLNVVVKDPGLKLLTDLKGKRLDTLLADSPVYLSRVVFAGKIDAATFFQLKQVRQPMKGVRQVLLGETDATLVDDGQMEQARKMEGGGALHTVYAAHSLPPLAMVAFGKIISADEAKKLQSALLKMCGTAKGGEVCRQMYIGKFAPVNASAFREAQKEYDQP